jgi:membrane protein implicated in regulation of membrane protease activity
MALEYLKLFPSNNPIKMMEHWHYWIIAGIVLCILEIFTADFLLIGLGVAAMAASIASYSEASMPWQVGVFAIVSVVFVFTIRPLAKKHFYKSSDPRTSNVDAMHGKRGIVVDPIPENGQPGRVKLGGEEWRAVTDDGVALEPGTEVVVERVDGATLHVRTPKLA